MVIGGVPSHVCEYRVGVVISIRTHYKGGTYARYQCHPSPTHHLHCPITSNTSPKLQTNNNRKEYARTAYASYKYDETRTNVWSRDREFGLCPVPQLGCGDIDTVLDARDRVRVHVVEARVGRVGARRWAASRARQVLAAIRVDRLGRRIERPWHVLSIKVP